MTEDQIKKAAEAIKEIFSEDEIRGLQDDTGMETPAAMRMAKIYGAALQLFTDARIRKFLG